MGQFHAAIVPPGVETTSTFPGAETFQLSKSGDGGTVSTVPRSAVSGDHSMRDDLTREYFTAARDGEGYIRLQRGKGLVVAGPDVERSQVQGWFDRSKSGRFREQCRAALAVFDMEHRKEHASRAPTMHHGLTSRPRSAV